MGTRLPTSFKSFLAKYGGGGIVEEEVSGIEADDPPLKHRGTVYNDTLLCREEYASPKHLIGVYLGDDDVVWCLDARELVDDEYPVVSFDVFSKKTIPLAPSFAEFLAEYLRLRISRA